MIRPGHPYARRKTPSFGMSDPQKKSGNRAEVGRWGEEEAAAYLVARGWTILARNYRWGHKEIDLIVRKGITTAFVEVKCRRGSTCGHPLEAITPSKRREIADVARAWLRQSPQPPGTLVRFDAIGIQIGVGGAASLVHVPDAWRLDR